jgi:hypothetical protein
MLSYISEILGKFTPQQRVIALLLLLFSIVLMTNGSDLIKAIKGVPDDVSATLEKQSAQIRVLQNETSRLNLELIRGQIECTDKIIEREEEIAIQIQNIMNMGIIRKRNAIILDTVGNKESQSPKIILEDNTNKDMVRELGKLKRTLAHEE